MINGQKIKRTTNENHETDLSADDRAELERYRRQFDAEILNGAKPENSSPRNKFLNLPLRLAVKTSAVALFVAMFAFAGLIWAFYANDNAILAYSFIALVVSGLIQLVAQIFCLFAKSQIGSKQWIVWSLLFAVPAVYLITVVWQGIDAGEAIKTSRDMPAKLFWIGGLCFAAGATSIGCYLTYMRSVGHIACDPMIQGDSRWVFLLFVATVIAISGSVYANEVTLPKMLRGPAIPVVPTLIQAMVGITGALFYFSSILAMVFFLRMNSEAKNLLTSAREPQWYDHLYMFFVREG